MVGGSKCEIGCTMREYFESAGRLAGDFAGVFECDGKTSYFYLYRLDASADRKIVRALKLELKAAQLLDKQITVFWSDNQNTVFLKAGGEVVAALSSD